MANKVVMLGAGHMGSAMIAGMLADRDIQVRVVDPDPSKLGPHLAKGVSASVGLGNLAPDETIVLAMPPQAFPAFAAHLPFGEAGHPGGIISVMAGVRIATIQAQLRSALVVRAIPNTPSEVFEGMTAFCAAPGIPHELIERTAQILGSIGETLQVESEDLIDPATALCGGGPAFVAYFADALQQFAIGAGFSEGQSRLMATQVLRGTAVLLEKSGRPARQLCQEVMTPNGTTERGIRFFEHAGLARTVNDALLASSDRSRELGIASNAQHSSEALSC
jgi:pyrroline-5-carboxylate reductase